MRVFAGDGAAARRSEGLPPSSKRVALYVVGAVAGVFAALGAIAGFRLLQVARDLDSARSMLTDAATAVEDGRLADAQQGLRQAETLLVRANGTVHQSTSLSLVSWVPVVDRNLASLRDSVGVALTIVSGGNRILHVAAPLQNADGTLEVPLQSGAIPIDTVRAARDEVGALAAELPGVGEEPSSSFIAGPIRDLRDEVYAEASVRRDQLDAVARGLDLMTELSGGNGPRTYLIAVANTAEMRGSGGMILSYGVLTGADGDFDLGAFGNIDELFLDSAVSPDSLGLPADYLRRWNVGASGGLQVTKLWRNANVAPDFTFVAPILEAMYEQRTGQTVDGVIQIDPEGLAAMLKGTGPVEVPSVGEVTADNVVALTLNEAYTRFPDRDTRQEVLGDVAEAVFKVLVRGHYESLRPLGEALFDAAAGRHIEFHSTTSQTERQAHFFGADGALPPADAQDYLHLTVQNLSANKVDYYLDTSVSVTGTRPAGEPGRLTARIELDNTAPVGGEPPYVFGPYDSSQVAGLYRGVVSLYLPTGVTLASSAGDAGVSAPQVTSEAGRTVVTFNLDVPASQSRTVELELDFPPRPPGPYRLVLVPSPRVRPTTVTASIDSGAGEVAGRVALDRTVVLGPS